MNMVRFQVLFSFFFLYLVLVRTVLSLNHQKIRSTSHPLFQRVAPVTVRRETVVCPVSAARPAEVRMWGQQFRRPSSWEDRWSIEEEWHFEKFATWNISYSWSSSDYQVSRTMFWIEAKNIDIMVEPIASWGAGKGRDPRTEPLGFFSPEA